ncbi:family 43 glycosylhydrolase [Paenibacillus macerans]|uniref:family 43 glycosylhydrolase n=1 Tax=Paenibacillus macerans TaxID=44252 RepID=UPI00203EDEC2|nr:family 43 glycosylhydrolase [Paenibacillus macerans]MCM3698073.1 family 43 glycosylhydrolase [Paenibacillus macerans]
MRKACWAGFLMICLGMGGAGCDPKGQDAVIQPTAIDTYANPITLPDEWEEYGLGDPFIFSYNGYYYLYVSTRDTDAGVKVWRSADLLEWKYEGLCTEDPITTAAYAPEVRYWNGKFYMYTSPAGQGHYVLESDLPTGPFRVATENFGRTIDGSTFVDDDGKWYFYYAGTEGIQAAPMADPLTVAPEETQTGAYMGGWTEGPTVFKRGGKYYMTYTGNHVFSSGYRVDAAVSASPLTGFAGFDGNPVLLRADGPTVGVGHNSIVTGPDLDTQYMIYHNLEGPGIVGPLRHMNIDRLVWNGSRFKVYGPTDGPQPAPDPPFFSDRFERNEIGAGWKISGEGEWSVSAEGGLSAAAQGKQGRSMLLAEPAAESGYSAEFHVQLRSEGQGGKAGVVFSYTDDENFGIVLLDQESREITAEVYRDGKAVDVEKQRIPDSLDIRCLQNLRLEVQNQSVRVYTAGMRLLTLQLAEAVGGGRIGYAAQNAEARFGYAAFSNKVNGSGDRLAYAPMPGAVDAIHAENAVEAKASAVDDGNGGYYLTKLAKGTTLSYRVNVTRSGTYSIHLRVAPGPDGVKFSLSDGSKEAAPAIEVNPPVNPGQWETVSFHGAKLESGLQALKLEVQQGSMDFAWMEANEFTPVTGIKDGFEGKTTSGWFRYEGEWSVKDGQLRASSLQPAKIVTGEYGWADYSVEADLTVPEKGGQTGLLIRVTDPANGLELNQNRDDFLRGYYVYADGTGLHLVKHNYDTVPLADAAYPLPPEGEWIHLKVAAVGTRITVYADNGSKPVLEYDDRSDRPFLHGKIGLKSVATASRFDEVEIRN